MFAPFGKRKAAVTAGSLPLHLVQGPTMGTNWTAQFAASNAAVDDIAGRLKATIEQVDADMSTWKPGSALSQFNVAAPGDWFAVPHDLALVVQHGLAVGRDMSGAFDMTVGRAVNDWGFGPDGMTNPPGGETPAPGLAVIEARLDPPALRKSVDLALDLSGIAKGFGVDQMAEVLERDGIDNYLVTLDGEVRCKGRKPEVGGAWSIGLDAPVPGEQRLWDVLTPADGALATSGDYRHFRVVDGKALAHTIDPATGRPLENGIASVSVHAPKCWQADAWATALMVLGPHKGAAVAHARQIAALFLVRGPDGLKEIATGQFNALCGRDTSPL